ncbi:hypothetical protein LX32DRAFT_700335 [Colletotrichum zoysiae]|uniref:Cyanovirin-N domain-containing protein n=1 Tax=Colletotrichum zoysiae TaxID=1216348 RepID=A0AAD9HUE8_9PEZI|nr:hypothetical protein LX32DRAFT_700335 [Colletotrichum zoysiae]
MKKSIVKTLIITLAAGAKVAEACGKYGYCRCTMADGSINNNVTTVACQKYHTSIGLDGTRATAITTTIDSGNTAWCSQGIFDDYHTGAPINCKMRDFCKEAGATGEDSWCELKY